MYDKFYETLMNDVDFEAKPMVLLIGQYSVGKTSFIRYLLECDYQGMRVGPEPTTDKFISVMYGDTERVIPGNAAAVSADLPFNSLQQFLRLIDCSLQCTVEIRAAVMVEVRDDAESRDVQGVFDIHFGTDGKIDELFAENETAAEDGAQKQSEQEKERTPAGKRIGGDGGCLLNGDVRERVVEEKLKFLCQGFLLEKQVSFLVD